MLLPDDLIDEEDELLGADARRAGRARRHRARADAGARATTSASTAASRRSGRGRRTSSRSATWSRSRRSADAPSDLAIIGRYVLPPAIFDALRATTPGAGGEIQLTDAMRRLAADGVPVHGVIFGGRRYDTGDRLDYLRAVVQLAMRHPDLGAEFSSWLRDFVGRLRVSERRAVAVGRRAPEEGAGRDRRARSDRADPARRAGVAAGRERVRRRAAARLRQLGDGRLRGARGRHDRGDAREPDRAAGGRRCRGRRAHPLGHGPGAGDADHDRGADPGRRRRGDRTRIDRPRAGPGRAAPAGAKW